MNKIFFLTFFLFSKIALANFVCHPEDNRNGYFGYYETSDSVFVYVMTSGKNSAEMDLNDLKIDYNSVDLKRYAMQVIPSIDARKVAGALLRYDKRDCRRSNIVVEDGNNVHLASCYDSEKSAPKEIFFTESVSIRSGEVSTWAREENISRLISEMKSKVVAHTSSSETVMGIAAGFDKKKYTFSNGSSSEYMVLRLAHIPIPGVRTIILTYSFDEWYRCFNI